MAPVDAVGLALTDIMGMLPTGNMGPVPAGVMRAVSTDAAGLMPMDTVVPRRCGYCMCQQCTVSHFHVTQNGRATLLGNIPVPSDLQCGSGLLLLCTRPAHNMLEPSYMSSSDLERCCSVMW